MFCIHCGKEIENDSKFCCYCGEAVQSVVEVEQQRPSVKNKVFAFVGFGHGIAAFVLSLIPFACFYSFLFVIPGFIFSGLGKNSNKENFAKKGKLFSTLGLIFGIIRGGVIAVALIGVCTLLSNIPVIGDPIYKEMNNAPITSKVYKYVDNFIEKNLTEEKVKDIIDRIVSDNVADDSNGTTDGETTNGGNELSSPYISITYSETPSVSVSI